MKDREDVGRILIVDDDEDILDVLQYNLVRQGFTVLTLADSTKVIPIATSFKPDLIVLDLMMPFLNGIDICRKIRSSEILRQAYVFFLTAKGEQYYRNAVFNVGGDDFVEKKTGLKPLLSKIHAVLVQKFRISKRDLKITHGKIELFRVAETVYKDGNKIFLSAQEFEVLYFLVQNSGKKISIKQLLFTIWGSETFMDESEVRNVILHLQKKLGPGVIQEKKHGVYCVV